MGTKKRNEFRSTFMNGMNSVLPRGFVMPQPLLPARFLFRFSAPCHRRDPLWTPDGAPLEERYRLVGLAELEERAVWADVRAAWSRDGLVFAVHREAGSSGPRTSDFGLRISPALHLWIDTRDVHNVHRAGRFCHQFRFRPGEGSGEGSPKSKARNPRATAREKGDGFAQMGPVPFLPAVAECLPINRAREQPHPIRPGALQARCQQRADGYILEAFLPAEALTGFDPAEHPRLGFTYAVLDRELGQQTFGVGSPMPYQEDPSLWATLELTT
jgi:hypothetical protein